MGMTVYTDLVSGDELISDSFDLIDKEDVVYEVDCSMITKGGETFNTGANASAEEADEGVEDGVQQVNNVVHSFRLEKVEGVYPTLKDYQNQFKVYLKKVVALFKEEGKSEEEIKAWQTKVQNYFVKVIKPNFKHYDFYTGESMNHEAMLLLLNYREDGVTPFFTIWKHPLKAVKV
ncbi:MAG: hypothetical protein GOMPHAMPRED_005884 [Gomphillus americanus]|uniref:Translationally-controlled tumor protein homolog n=1 Tax=Gomphillus americanus TaxID=1940652 RepID=A0A8H3IWM2_9LECA|nr:MAG: hypothetical protein GOMPHAMPRED_005884 [Gomphillus americanus]